MPLRYLQPGITTSKRFNALSFEAQSLYVRLVTLVDDYGRFEGSFGIIRSYAFPLGNPQTDDIQLSAIADMCRQLSDNGLCNFYKDEDGKEVVQVLRWRERARAKFSKYKEFADNCQQMFASVGQVPDLCGQMQTNAGLSRLTTYDLRPTPSDPRATPAASRASPVASELSRPAPAGSESSGGALPHAEIKKRLGGISMVAFQEKKKESFWTNPQVDFWLDQALPIVEEEMGLLEWAYALPMDDEFRQATKLRRSLESLLENLRPEIQKIRTVRKELDLDDGTTATPRPEPDLWREAYRSKYPEAELPESFWELSPELRSRLPGLLEDLEKKERPGVHAHA
jgi:hypothetical protein